MGWRVEDSTMNESFNDSYYDLDYENEICDKGEVVLFGSATIPAFFSVVTLLSLMGNIVVLVILALYENLKSLTNIFILNLAISDLIFTAGLPFWGVYHIWGWVLPTILCNIVTFIFHAGFYSGILFLTIMSIYRYLAVVHPLSNHGTQKVNYGVPVSITLWLISFAVAMPSLLYSAVIAIHHNDEDTLGCEYKDSLWKNVSIIQQNIFFLAAFAVMGFCYIQILRKIKTTRSHRRNKTVRLIFCIVAVFLFGWTPYNLVIVLRRLADYLIFPFDNCDQSNSLDYAFFVCRLVAYSHCCLNPVLYALVGVKFRNHMKSLLNRMFCHQSQAEAQPVRMSNFHSNASMF